MIEIIERKEEEKKIKDFLDNFNNNNSFESRGMYVYGEAGCGKTIFVMNLLNKLNYDIIKYEFSDIRSKSIIELLNNRSISYKNVTSFFTKKEVKMVIVIDEIDGLNNTDKSCINSLIKLVRLKKTQKQKNETFTQVPIIFIGKKDVDKKNKELMKVCNLCELYKPNRDEIDFFLKKNYNINDNTRERLLDYIDNDFRKLKYITILIENDVNILDNLLNIICDDTNVKKITNKLLKNKYKVSDHSNIINDTDRTIVGLLWHENIIDFINKINIKEGIKLYSNILKNICYADYMDRVTFQKQIWQFNEISSLIKTFYTNYILHTYKENNNIKIKVNEEIRFTKVLTKYSTEYNNLVFTQGLCQELSFDRKDMIGFFYIIKKNLCKKDIDNLSYYYDINELDVNRIIRYIDYCLFD
tara:strand:+ start:1570 stop:2811 length:1242 start_codon:yes stop_codon:yes gene_type:complete